jgi:hypothetical protein
MRKSLPIEELHRLFVCDAKVGRLWWKYRDDVNPTWNIRWAGKEAGGPIRGYWQVIIHYKNYRRHRIIWAMHYGFWPKNGLDHRKGTGEGDGIANLREASQPENTRNVKIHHDNGSGLKGVCWHKAMKKWHAQLMFDGIRVLSEFSTCPAAASFVYQIAADKHFGEFARFA